MIKSMLPYMKISKEKKDKLVGCYLLPFLIPVVIALFGILLLLASRYKKVETLLKKIAKKLERYKNVWL